MQDNKFVAKWERTRQRGMALYIVQYCTLIFFSTLVGVAIAHMITEISSGITIAVITGQLIGSIVAGIYRWHSNEDKYKELKGIYS